MLIRVISDIHLEFFKNDDFKLDPTDNENETILILAGDITVATHMKRFEYFFEDISNRFKQVLYICGNHEYYGGSIGMTPVKIRDVIKKFKNIKLLEDDKVEIDEVVFLCSTLWTDFSNENPLVMMKAHTQMNDFRKIRIGPKDTPWMMKFTPDDALRIHNKSKEFIFKNLKNKDKNKKYVMLNHHGSSLESIAPIFKTDKLNGAYVSNLESEILEYQPDLIIHGHTHVSFDYMIGNTRVVCNPFGYKKYEENPDFNNRLLIEL